MTQEIAAIDTSYACFGIVFNEEGIAVNVPPIAKWALGKKKDYIIAYFKKKGAKINIAKSECK